LEQQLADERNKNKALNQVNFRLRERNTKFVEFLQNLASEEQKDLVEEERDRVQMEQENKHLRDILGISRVSDPKFEEIDQYLKDKLNDVEEEEEFKVNRDDNEILNADDLRLTPNVIAGFKKDRERMFSLQRTFSTYSDKSVKGNTATRTVNSHVSTENFMEASAGTPTSSQTWESLRFVNTTNGSISSDK